MSGNWGAALGALMPVVWMMLAMITAGCVVTLIGIRVLTRGKIACTFHKNHRKSGALLKYDAENQCVWLGGEADPNREKYNVTEDEIEWIEWPGTLPHFFCVTLRSLEYIRGVPTPINMSKRASTNITAKALRLQSDGNVLQAVYMHARSALGIKGKAGTSMIGVLLLVVITAVSLFNAYSLMKTGSQQTMTDTRIRTIQEALGIESSPVTPVVPVKPVVPLTPVPTTPVPTKPATSESMIPQGGSSGK